MIINPYRHAAAGGNGLATGIVTHVDLGDSLTDDVGSGDLTATGTSATSGTAPDGGNARLFGTGDKLTSSAGTIWGSGTTMTISVWVKLTRNVGGYLWGHPAPNGYSNAQFLAISHNLRWYFDATFLGDVTSTGALNNWINVVATSNGPGTASDEIFINNVSKDTGGGGWEPGSAAFYLGASQTGAPSFEGEMVGLTIWDRVLSSDDRTALFNSGTNLRYAGYT